MQLTLTNTLLLLLPALTAATLSPPNSARGLTDKVKGLFGDPVAMVENFSPCMRECVREGYFELDCALEKNCGCGAAKGGDGKDSTAGQEWEDQTQKCFTNKTVDGCGEKEYDQGKVLDLCKAIGDDKNNATYGTVMRKIVFAVYEDGNPDAKGKEAKGKDAKGAAGNGTEKSGAAGVVGQVGGLRRVATAVLVAAVGWAVAMI